MIDIMVPVWGRKYCDYLTEYFLPSLMSTKNLPLLRASDGHRLLVATTEKDWEYLLHRPILSEIMDHIIPEGVIISDPQVHDGTFAGYAHVIKSQTIAQILLLKTQRGRGCLCSPDFIFSNEVIDCILRHEGLVLIPMLRQAEENFLPGRKWGPRSLAAMLVSQLHPEMEPYKVSPGKVNLPINPPFRLYPQAEGLLFYTHHAVMFGFPPGGEIPSNIECEYFGRNFKDAYIVQDSDECCIASIGPRNVDWSNPVKRKPQGYLQQLLDIRQSNKAYCTGMPLKEKLYRTPIRWRDYGPIGPNWKAKEKQMERMFYWALDNRLTGLGLDIYMAIQTLFGHALGFAKQRYLRKPLSSMQRSTIERTQ